MESVSVRKFLVRSLCLWALVLPLRAAADDIDLFISSNAAASTFDNPNVLIIVDNTANWSRQDQKWPGGVTQGQSELQAIKTVIGSLDASVNLGLMMFTDTGAGRQGGYIRFPVMQMTADNKTAFQNLVQYVYDNFGSPSEKTASSANYSAVIFDAFKYFGGYTSPAHVADGAAGAPQDATHFGPAVFNTRTDAVLADVGGYTDASRSTYAGPISADNACARNFVIFIGNGFPNSDSGNPNQMDTYLSGIGGDTSQIALPLAGGGYAVPAASKARMADEWSRYLYQTDVNSAAGQQNVSTYTIDVYNAKQDTDQTALLTSMARVGGGKYFAATNQDAIISALKQIIAEVQAVNSVFASASLPVNAANRTQNENQVFIGMFRPDPAANPRWYGNLKRYQLAEFAGFVDLADANGTQAVNLQTGFIAECATSFWTSDSGNYWQTVPSNPPAEGRCTSSAFSKWSDSPDGPFVEKGAAAEVVRKGNNPPATDTTPTWAVNRTIKTLDATGTALTGFDTTSSGLAQSLVDFISGKDVNDENANGSATTETRASLHGDLIHSRPLPLNYGTDTGITVYYGSNDGTLRAVNAADGKERWAFIAPEFFSRLSRLQSNSPLIQFPNQAAGITPTPTPKDYYFDGSIGAYQNLDNSNVWIFPTMRRGGRMVYALDVTTPGAPVFKWRLGCPNLGDDTGCSAGMSGIGQTWALPSVALIKGYSTTKPVIVLGGGYDGCEDQNSSTPTCSSPKGAAIYVIDADDGTILKTFTTSRSVAADVAMVDVDNDGFVDYAYAADTGGDIYRIDFVDGAASFAPLSASNWQLYRVAYTGGSGRKFLFPPALLASSGHVYVALGSGDREHPLLTQYPYTDVTNRFYVYLDNLSAKPTSAQSVNLDDTSVVNNNTGSTSCSSSQLVAGSSIKGWFMDLNQYGQGEQTVTSALILGGMVTFSTNRPIPPAAGSCSTTLGEARGYWVNLLNASGGVGVGTSATCGGSRSAAFVGGGLPPSPVTGTVPIAGVPRTVVIGAVRRDNTVSAPIGGQNVQPAIKSTRKRIYWFTNTDSQ